jgi:tetratricopeptide (TPR) repeat protein
MAVNAWSRPAAATVAIILCAATPASAQRTAFVDALIDFNSALFGTWGDEGPLVVAALDRMTAALDTWEGEQRQAVADPVRRGTPPDRALLHAEHLQLEAALAAMEEAVAAEPARAPLHVYLGRLQDALGRRAEAGAAFDTARRLDPSDPVAAYLVGLNLMERATADGGQTSLAPVLTTLMQAASRRGPRPLVPHFTLVEDLSAPARVFAPPLYENGFALISRRQFRDAVAMFRSAAATDPLVADPATRSAQLRGGVAALRAGNGADAIQQLQAVVREYPNSSEAHRVLGVAYRAARRLAEATASFEAAVARAPADERARVALGSTLHEAGKLDDAERVLRDTIGRLPSSGEARWALAPVYEDLHRPVEAIATLTEAASLIVVAGKAHLYWRIAQLVHLYHRDHARVIDVLTRRVRLVPNEPHAHKDLGLAYVRAGMDDESLTELLMATLLGLEDAETLTAIGQIHLRQARLNLAETSLARAATLDPAAAETRYALGQTLRRLGREAEAAEHLAMFDKLRQAALDEQRQRFERESRP